MHHKTLASLLLIALSPVFAFCADNPPLLPRITVEGNQFVVAGKPIFMSGANTPWNLWNDFGKSSFNPDWWDNHYSQFNANGLNSSRVWITCSGEVGINIDSNGYVSGATDKHWSDLDQLFQIAQSRGVYIMATLLSFDHFKTHYTTWQRWRNWINSDANVDSYIANYLIPFVQRYGNNTALWSIDLINEPDWATTDEGGPIEWSRFQRFFAKASKAIHDNSPTLVTVGIAVIKYNSDVGSMKNVVSDSALRAQLDAPEATLDFWSTHWYSWMEPYWSIPMYVTPSGFDLDTTKPSVLGECPAYGSGDTLTGDFESAYQNGWSGILPWTSNGVDDNGGWTEVIAASNAFVTNHREAVFPNTYTHPAPHPMPVISRNAPAFASSGNPSHANDSSYSTIWRSNGTMPQWIAYDISGVPASQRARAVVFWDSGNYNYASDIRYNVLGEYSIDAHAAPGRGNPPPENDPGWVTLASFDNTPEKLNSRQHTVNLTQGNVPFHWIRLRVTQINGSPMNTDAMVNLDIHDAHQGVEDSWIFFGDSITAGAMKHTEGGGLNFSQIVNETKPDYFPVYENGGMAGWHTFQASEALPKWINDFGGQYVGISFGTNDAGWAISPSDFYDNFETLVLSVVNAGKIPVIPTIPWSPESAYSNNIPGLNAALDQLKNDYPTIVDGPDFWAFYRDNPTLISSDGIHPTDAGYLEYRRLWAEKMLEVVYSGSVPNPDNHPPVLETIGYQSAQVGQTIQFTIQANDEDADPLTYSASGAP